MVFFLRGRKVLLVLMLCNNNATAYIDNTRMLHLTFKLQNLTTTSIFFTQHNSQYTL